MSTFVEIAPHALDTGTADRTLLESHMRYVMLKKGPGRSYPVSIRLGDGPEARVTRGQAYVRIAQELGWPSFVCFVEGEEEELDLVSAELER
jgi:hypothetical protein